MEKIAINGYAAGIGPVGQGAYAFWTVEHLYTFGQPKAGSLTAAFLAYMSSVTASDTCAATSTRPALARCTARSRTQMR